MRRMATASGRSVKHIAGLTTKWLGPGHPERDASSCTTSMTRCDRFSTITTSTISKVISPVGTVLVKADVGKSLCSRELMSRRTRTRRHPARLTVLDSGVVEPPDGVSAQRPSSATVRHRHALAAASLSEPTLAAGMRSKARRDR